MNSIRQIQRLNAAELEKGIPPSASWHVDYRDTAYINIGGLSYDLTEGDIITIFSQFGEPVFVKIMRDKTTGKSRGFAWLKYEDQRSCDLAVDNLGGATVLGRMLRVDHARYKRRDDEESEGEEEAKEAKEAKVGAEERERESRVERKLLKEELELQKLLVEHDDEDPMKEYLVTEKKKEVEKALERQRMEDGKHERREHKHHRRRERPREEGRSDERRREHRRDASEDDDERRERRRHRGPDGQRQRSPKMRDSSEEARILFQESRRRYRSDSDDQPRRKRAEHGQRRDRTSLMTKRRDNSVGDGDRGHTPDKSRRRDRSPEYRRSGNHRRGRSRSP